ncbi:hypothetical protein ACFC0M_06195 [Streptomyces sp. NPDC056149]|uniref:hypothetical protein n=1 Tax=Streptomyces sp. NPDC056149 TaxID=3345728 RepID=UPI0035DE50D1
MTGPEALEAVLADLRTHQVNPDLAGHFTAMRHISLLNHLALRYTADAYHTLAGDLAADNPVEEALVAHQTAATIGQALAHYTQALPALTKASDPANHTTLKRQLETITHHSALRRHLDAAQRKLDEAGTVLKGVTPLPTNTPTPTATQPPTPPNTPPRHGR